MIVGNLTAVVQVAKIDEKRVLCKRDMIAQHVQRNHYEKLAAYGIMASIIGSGIYYMMPQGGELVTLSRKEFEAMSIAFAKAISEKSNEVAPVVQQAVAAQPAASNIFVSTFNGLKNTFGSIFGMGKEFVVWSVKTGWQGAVSSFLLHHMLAASRIPERYAKPFKNFGARLEDGAANVYDRLFFKPTLQWYITRQTHLKNNFKQLYTYAYVIEHHRFPEMMHAVNHDDMVQLCDVGDHVETQFSDAHIQLYFEKFESAWALSLHDIEGIIGFLEFKKTHVPECANEYEYTIRAIRLVVGNFITLLESRYSNVWKTEQMISELAQEIKKFTHLLQVECDSCIIAEHAYA